MSRMKNLSREMLGMADLEPDKAFSMLRKYAKSIFADSKNREVYDNGTDEEACEQLEKDLRELVHVLSHMAHCAHCAGKKYPKMLKNWQAGMCTLEVASHEFFVMLGYCPEVNDPGHDDFYTQVWRVPGDYTKETFSTVSWMVDRMSENIIVQLFPVDTNKKMHEAMYNFYVNLAATCASELMETENENCDWAGILENGKYLEANSKQEIIVDGVRVTDPDQLGNPYIEKIQNERKKYRK